MSPYIPQAQRPDFDKPIEELATVIETAGHLNYAITRLVRDWIEWNGESYETLNSAIGVLECAKLELARRVVSPYEDRKIEQNGDVV